MHEYGRTLRENTHEKTLLRPRFLNDRIDASSTPTRLKLTLNSTARVHGGGGDANVSQHKYTSLP